MEIDIHLNRSNRKILKSICKRLFPEYKKVVIRKKIVTFKRKWYSLRKTHTQVIDLVLLYIPQAINELCIDNDANPLLEYFDSRNNAVEYFHENVGNRDVIKFLQYQIDNVDLSLLLNKNYSYEPLIATEPMAIVVDEGYFTKKTFGDAIRYYYNLITDVIAEIHPVLRVIYVDTKSACNSPPIRAPGDIVTLLSA